MQKFRLHMRRRQWKKRLLWLNIAKISFGIMHIALNPRCKQYNKGIEWSPRPYISLLCQGLRNWKLRICGFEHYSRRVFRFSIDFSSGFSVLMAILAGFLVSDRPQCPHPTPWKGARYATNDLNHCPLAYHQIWEILASWVTAQMLLLSNKCRFYRQFFLHRMHNVTNPMTLRLYNPATPHLYYSLI